MVKKYSNKNVLNFENSNTPVKLIGMMDFKHYEKLQRPSLQISKIHIQLINLGISMVFFGVAIYIYIRTRSISKLNSSDVPTSTLHPIRSHIGLAGSSTHFVVPSKAILTIIVSLLIGSGIYYLIVALDVGSFYSMSINMGYPILFKWIAISLIIGSLSLVISIVIGVIDLTALVLVTTLSIVSIMCLMWAEMSSGIIVAYITTLISMAIVIAVLYSSHRTRDSEASSGIYSKQNRWRFASLVVFSLCILGMLLLNFATVQENIFYYESLTSIVLLLGVVSTCLIIALGLCHEIKL